MSTNAPAKSSKARDPRSVQLGYRTATEYGALSSDGERIYTVCLVAGVWTCTCLGYASRRVCCHSKAAGLLRCQHCDAAGDLTSYVNAWDNGAEITLCRDCGPRPASQRREVA